MKHFTSGLVFIVVAACANAQQLMHLTLQSPPGEWIGGGQNWDVTYTDFNTAFFNVQLDAVNGSPLPNFMTISAMQLPISTNYLLAQFGTDRLGHELRPGTYLNAERAGFASAGHPGLDISFQHRGSNTLTGSFVINSIGYHQAGANWVLDNFDVSFIQNSEGGPLALTGTLTYVVPEPASFAVLSFASLLLLKRKRERV